MTRLRLANELTDSRSTTAAVVAERNSMGGAILSADGRWQKCRHRAGAQQWRGPCEEGPPTSSGGRQLRAGGTSQVVKRLLDFPGDHRGVNDGVRSQVG